jgi:hypothetical protein
MSFQIEIFCLKGLVTTLLLVAVIAFAIVVFASEHILRQPVVVRPAAMTKEANLQRRSSVIETELITVTRRGFEPTTISRPEGKFILMIENPAWRNLNLRFSRDSGESVNQIRASREEPDWNEVQDLRPGRYVLTEQNHPEWTCLITITAR